MFFLDVVEREVIEERERSLIRNCLFFYEQIYVETGEDR